MSDTLVSRSVPRIQEIRQRLRANAVKDTPIDLSRPRGVTGYEVERRQGSLVAVSQDPKPCGQGLHPIRYIQDVVAEDYDISVYHMLSSVRTDNPSIPHDVAMYLAKVLTDKSFNVIGRRFRNRDYDTVAAGVSRVAYMIGDESNYLQSHIMKLRKTLQYDLELKERVERLREKIQNDLLAIKKPA